ncbi:MAG: phytanoyl-CoA dioxygenase family protein [Granulosicoccus sp.]
MNKSLPTDVPGWVENTSNAEAELQRLCEQTTMAASVPMAVDIVNNVPVYAGDTVRQLVAGQNSTQHKVKALQHEWARVLQHGAGVVAVRNAIDDLAMLDGVSAALRKIMDMESRAGSGADHFAVAGSNTRIWNSHEKLCITAPELFARYNANDTLALVATAWLGPGYQITAQANIVHPGGKAQQSHRDYHMGFQQSAELLEYPAHVHAMTPMLTLQGAIAHTDMPIESGPTQLLPFSQTLLSGYLAAARGDCRRYFESHYVQLPLARGDMLFFNPALLHAAGDNHTSDVHRFANLLQIGSAYGRTMELLDRTRMCIKLYPALHAMLSRDEISGHALQQVVAACAEGYPFPANMDLQPPVDGLAPASQQQLMLEALRERRDPDVFAQRLTELQLLKRTH